MASSSRWNGRYNAPQALRLAHDELRAELVRAALEPGAVGMAARNAARLCLPHYEHEELDIFPALGVLSDLAHGALRPDMAAVMPLVRRFSAWYAQVGKERQVMLDAIGALQQAAIEEDDHRAADLAYNMTIHERIDEEVLFPVVCLIGQYLTERLGLPEGKERS